MTSSEPSSREGPNQFRPLTDASPGSAQPPGRRVPRPLRRRPTTTFTLSFERKASPFFANVQSEFTNPLTLSAAEIRAAIADFRWGKLSSSRTHRQEHHGLNPAKLSAEERFAVDSRSVDQMGSA